MLVATKITLMCYRTKRLSSCAKKRWMLLWITLYGESCLRRMNDARNAVRNEIQESQKHTTLLTRHKVLTTFWN